MRVRENLPAAPLDPMLVRDVSASARFYRDALGFRLVLADAKDGAWALLRRGDAEVLLEDRARWPETAVPLTETGALTLCLAFDGAEDAVFTDPDGVRVVVTGQSPPTSASLRQRAA